MSDEDAVDLMFRAGVSTAAKLSDVSGRGVGMDVVRDAIARLKGNVRLSSTLGAGTTVELSLPLTLAITPVLTARVGGERVATFPDMIGTLDPATGECVSISESRPGGMVAVLVAHRVTLPLGRGPPDPAGFPEVDTARGHDLLPSLRARR